MSARMSGIGWGRRAAAFWLSAALGAGAVLGLLAVAEPFAMLTAPPVHVPWWSLIPFYVATSHFTIDFEFRREARSLHLSEIPLTLGLAFLAPAGHLAARSLGVLLDSAFWRRQPPVKAAFNISSGLVEVATASAALTLLGGEPRPGPHLWLAVLIALVVGQLVSHTTLTAVLRILRVPVTLQQMLQPLGFAAIAEPLFASLGILAVAALWTQPLTAFVLPVLAAGLTMAYRSHRSLSAQQAQTTELYEFVKDLGPLDERSPEALEVLEQMRVLLHAKALDLGLVRPDGGLEHLVVRDPDHADLLDSDADQSALSVASITGPTTAGDRMTTPLVGHGGVIGLLTAHERLGSVRDFNLGDMRLLETTAAELTTALERGRLIKDLGKAATTDTLTGLPNLSEVSRRIDAFLSSGTPGIVTAVAVDSFREVNDTLGHEVGDELLLEVTRRLQVCHPEAIIGRIGGGRFALCVPADPFGGDAAMFGLGVRAQVEGGAQLGPVGTHVRLSVGCVTAPQHGTDASTLIRRAETAMYSARHAHGGPVMWEPVYEVEGQRRLAVVMALREALASGAIGVAYQPKIDAQTLQITGVEALARWTHPALGAIRPDEFIPLAEASGLMGPLTSSVMRQALTACKGWQRRAGRVGVAVNVSADTVLDPGFVTEVAALLTSTSVSPDLLTLELTEGVLVDDPKLAADRMAELRALGVKLSVDDFGTGYSSLTYLKGLPMDEVKIDKGFVDDVVADAGDRAVVRAVVDIAHTLGLRVVAEGVEQEEQHRVLVELGVDEVQGYLHARPMPALDVAAWLRRRELDVRPS